MPKNLSGCMSCRIRKKLCRVPHDKTQDCIHCLRLNIECLRRYGEPIPRGLRDLQLENHITEFTRRRANLTGPMLCLRSLIPPTLLENCHQSSYVGPTAIHGGTTLMVPQFTPRDGGFLHGELPLVTTPDFLLIPPDQPSTPSALSCTSSDGSDPSPLLPHAPISSQPPLYNSSTSALECASPFIDSEFTATCSFGAGGVRVGGPADQNSPHYWVTNPIGDSVVSGKREWPKESKVHHHHSPTLPLGFLEASPLWNVPAATSRPLGGDIQYSHSETRFGNFIDNHKPHPTWATPGVITAVSSPTHPSSSGIPYDRHRLPE